MRFYLELILLKYNKYQNKIININQNNKYV